MRNELRDCESHRFGEKDVFARGSLFVVRQPFIAYLRPILFLCL